MKNIIKHQNLPLLVFAGGVIGIALRIWLLTTENDRGFLDRGHISIILLMVLTAVMAGLLFFRCRDLQQGEKYSFNFPASSLGGIGCIAAAAGVALTSATELLTAADFLELAAAVVGLLAAGSLVFVGHRRWKGLQPSVLLHTLVCVWLLLRLICLYRSWSSDPQLQDYCFELLALVCAMLGTYHRATFDADFGKRCPYVFFSLASVYFCLISLVSPSDTMLFFALGLWQLTNLCSLNPMPKELPEENNEAS